MRSIHVRVSSWTVWSLPLRPLRCHEKVANRSSREEASYPTKTEPTSRSFALLSQIPPHFLWNSAASQNDARLPFRLEQRIPPKYQSETSALKMKEEHGTIKLVPVYEAMQCLRAAWYSDLNLHPGRTTLEPYLRQRIPWNSSWLSSDSPAEYQNITSIKTWPFTSQLSAVHHKVITLPFDMTYLGITTASLNKIINILRNIPEANNVQSHCPDTLKSHTI